MKHEMKTMLAAAVAILLCVLACWLVPTVFLGAYLVAWLFWIGLVLGAVGNVWLHNLTGGQWGEAIRGPLLKFSRTMPVASILALPVLIGMQYLYPWAPHAAEGAARWQGELARPEFKSLWLMPGFFIARSVFYLLVWNGLVWLSLRPGWQRAKLFSALALIVYTLTSGLAAADWIMSLTPLWYSTVFGWIIGINQMLSGMALAIVFVAYGSRTKQPAPLVFRDLGNLLLMYVLTWAYLAFSQFLIIWAENLPHEIVWYAQRNHGPWLILGGLLTLFLFFAPLLALLSRDIKQTPHMLGGLAVAMLAMQVINNCWLVLPSLAAPAWHWLWAVPLAVFTLGTIALLLWRHWREEPLGQEMEARHV